MKALVEFVWGMNPIFAVILIIAVVGVFKLGPLVLNTRLMKKYNDMMDKINRDYDEA